eukprot:8771413-Lingulodinium_polyedra.AAC.1
MPLAKVGHVLAPPGHRPSFALRPCRLEHAEGLRPRALQRAPTPGGGPAGRPRFEARAQAQCLHGA